MCGRYYLGESEETSFWVDKTIKMKMPLEELAGNYLKMIGYVMEAVV